MSDPIILSIYHEFYQDSRYLIERGTDILIFWVRNTKRSYTLTKSKDIVTVKSFSGEFGPKSGHLAHFGLNDPELMVELREFMT